MTRPHATQPGSAADARRLLAGLPEGATPGPWGDVGYGHIAQDGNGENPSIVVCDWDGETESANCALIAAAPTLRDALTAALDREAALLVTIVKARTMATEAAIDTTTDTSAAVILACVAAVLTEPGDCDG